MASYPRRPILILTCMGTSNLLFFLIFCVSLLVYFFFDYCECSHIVFADWLHEPETSFKHHSRNTLPLSKSDFLHAVHSLPVCTDPHESTTCRLPPFFFYLHFNTLFSSVLALPSLFHPYFTNQQSVYAFLFFLTHAMCQDLHTILVFIIVIKFSEGWKLSSS